MHVKVSPYLRAISAFIESWLGQAKEQSMKAILKTVITLTLAMGAFSFAQASAEYRPDYCSVDHDHRSHDTSYYDYYSQDRYSRAGSYRASRSSSRYNDYSYRGRSNR